MNSIESQHPNNDESGENIFEKTYKGASAKSHDTDEDQSGNILFEQNPNDEKNRIKAIENNLYTPKLQSGYRNKPYQEWSDFEKRLDASTKFIHKIEVQGGLEGGILRMHDKETNRTYFQIFIQANKDGYGYTKVGEKEHVIDVKTTGLKSIFKKNEKRVYRSSVMGTVWPKEGDVNSFSDAYFKLKNLVDQGLISGPVVGDDIITSKMGYWLGEFDNENEFLTKLRETGLEFEIKDK